MSLLVKDINLEKVPTTKRAAMYYKTEPLYTNIDLYVHTNNWEILQAIRLLNKRGYTVDLIDRKYENWRADSPYDLFLGLGVGNRGRCFPDLARSSQAPTKILLAMGPQPDVSNELVLRRYKMFNERTKSSAPPMRTVQDVTGDKFLELVDTADCIFNIGEKDTPSYNSYLPYNTPVINFLPSTSPKVGFAPNWLDTRNLNSYLCFAGNGFICKGVDVVVESFLKDSTKELHICGPPTETAFFEHYGDTIRNAPNIYYHGFIEPGAAAFNQLASHCAFVLFHSAAEGCCTSVATAMRAGLVPIINAWTGILVDGIGIDLPEEGDIIQTITDATTMASSMDLADYSALVQGTLQKSLLFSQESFTKSYGKALDKALKM
tara:strand:+ start:6998 stop:8128 length:1131 start_codon:yes stop_codon:yes gene_type:complete